MTCVLWLIAETPAARKFSRVPPGTPRVSEIWIPRSLVKNIVKIPLPGLTQFQCELEVEDWFAKKNNL